MSHDIFRIWSCPP